MGPLGSSSISRAPFDGRYLAGRRASFGIWKIAAAAIDVHQPERNGDCRDAERLHRLHYRRVRNVVLQYRQEGHGVLGQRRDNDL